MKKRILSMLLVIAMVLCMLPTVFAASSGTLGDNVTWTLDDNGTLTVSGNGAMDNYFFGGSPLMSVSSGIQRVIIQPGVTTIGDCAFFYCTNLTNVTIGSSVTSIGETVFYGCSKLDTINVDSGNTAYKSVNGVLLDKAGHHTDSVSFK